MTTTKTISVALVRAAAAFALSLSTAVPVAAADWSRAASSPVPASYVGEFGTRFWFGRAQTKKDLFDTTGAILVSRLDYYDMNIFTGEAFARLDFNNGWFVKGYCRRRRPVRRQAQGRGLPAGHRSLFGDAERQQERLADLRQRRRRHQARPRAGFPCRRVRRLSLHARLRRRHGLHPDRDQSGHLRAGGIPDIRPRHLADQQLALAARRPRSVGGVRPALEAHGRRRLAALCARSTAPTRICCGSAPIPATSPARSRRTARAGATRSTPSSPTASTTGISVGAGGRYWHVEAKGHTHFEGHVVGVNAQPQVVHWRADHFGGFIQASIKFGPYPV